MRIAFDGSCMRPRRTGVGYYGEHLLHHLAAAAVDDELTVISNRSVSTDTPLPPAVRVVTAPRRVPRMVWMQMHAPATLKAIDADVAHFTNGMLPLNTPVPTVVTIHDVSLRLYPRHHPPRRVLLNGPLDDLAMMYSATYDPAFYRGLYALVHAEFRLRQSARRVAQAAVRGWTLRSRHLRELAAVAYRAAAIPFLRWTLARAARPAAAPVPALLTPLASPRAAAVPTDQASLE